MVEGPHVPEQDLTAVKPDARLEVSRPGHALEEIELLFYVDRGKTGAVFELRLGARRHPEGQHGIADHPGDEPPVALHRPEHRLVVAVHELSQLVGVHGLGEGRVVLRVGEEAHAVDDLAARPDVGHIPCQLRHHVLGEVVLECLLDVHPLLFRIDVVPHHGPEEGERRLEKEGHGDGVPDVMRRELIFCPDYIDGTEPDGTQRSHPDVGEAAKYPRNHAPE